MIEFLTAVLVIVTALYAFITYKILMANQQSVQSMKLQYISYIRPYVVTEIYIATNAYFYLKIKNAGVSNAENLKLNINKSFYTLAKNRPEEDISKRYEFNNIIKSFPPKSELVIQLAHGSQLYSDKYDEGLTPLQFQITAQYNYGIEKFNEELNIDLKQYENMILLREPITEELHKMNELLKENLNQLRNKNII